MAAPAAHWSPGSAQNPKPSRAAPQQHPEKQSLSLLQARPSVSFGSQWNPLSNEHVRPSGQSASVKQMVSHRVSLKTHDGSVVVVVAVVVVVDVLLVVLVVVVVGGAAHSP